MSRKVLIISTHFAPDIHIGAKRPTKFCKFLPKYGWQPIVVTQEIERYRGIDSTLLTDLPDDVEIHRIKEWHWRKKQQAKVSAQPASKAAHHSSSKSWRSKVVQVLDGLRLMLDL